MPFRIGFKAITDKDDLVRFQELSARKIGVKLPMEYLENARVVALRNKKSRDIYGGFIMAYQGTLRCLDQIPVEALQNNPHLQQKIDRCFEINGLWLDKDNTPTAGRFRLYVRCIFEALRMVSMGKTRYVYAYSADNPKLRRFYQTFQSTKIYEGPVKLLNGMDKDSVEVVEMGQMSRLPKLVISNPGFLLRRFSRGRGMRRLKRLQATWIRD